MTNIFKIFILIASLIFISNNSFAGRNDKAGTAAAAQLFIPAGARDIAMSGSTHAFTTGIEAIYWNPAGLSNSNSGASAIFSHMNYIADIGVDYFAASSSFEGFGSIGFSLKSLSIGDIPVTTEEQPDGTGSLISPTFVTLGVTYSKKLSDNTFVGVTTNLISETMDRVNATGVAFNAGIQYHNFAGFDGLSLGLVVKNIGASMQYDGSGLIRQGDVDNTERGPSFYKVIAAEAELPSTIEIGLGYKHKIDETDVLSFSGLFQNNNFASDEYKVGVEYGYNDLFYVRGGTSFSQDIENESFATSDKTNYIFGPTFGFGVNQDFGDMKLGIDYAYRTTQFFDGNNIFSITLGF